MKKQKNKALSIFIILAFSFLIAGKVSASVTDDFEYYQKYQLYPKYEKKQKYDKYKKYKKNKDKYGFDSAKEKAAAKSAYEKYKLYKKDQKKYSSYAQYYEQYKKYSKYKKYVTPYSKYKKYKKYKNYNKDSYEGYKNYGSAEYKAGYDRYVAFMNDLTNVTSATGSEIRVGLWSYSKDDLRESPFKITANKIFNVTDCDETIIGEVPIGENARVTYAGDPEGTLETYNNNDTPLFATTDLEEGRVCFEAKDGNSSDMIFDINRPSSDYDQYRGKIKLQYSNTSDNESVEGGAKRIWVINALPLEHYMWGYGEMATGGVTEHAKAMVVAARSYARWYIEYATRWSAEGFHILSTSSSQIYKGYDYETDHLFIKDAAQKTNGIVMKYGDENEYVLGAYCSYTDGNTRTLDDYPYLISVPDPYGKNNSMTTEEMVAAGNHMWGMSANGSLVLARDYEWSYTAILSYYYTNISIVKDY